MSSFISANLAKSMADLMSRSVPTFTKIKKGEMVKGKITKLSQDGVLVDINAKTDALVLEKDSRFLRRILSSLKLGDDVTVSVLNPESDMGYPVVSLRRFMDEMQWDVLAKKQLAQESIEVIVKDVTKGGFLVDSKIGPSGFLPQSQLLPTTNTNELVGKRIDVYVLETNKPSNRFIVSQKAVMGEKEFSDIIKNMKVGEKMQATITNVAPFGIFVSLVQNFSVNGFIHISEVSWSDVSVLQDEFKTGQSIEAIIIGFDRGEKRIELSIRRLTSDPFIKSIQDMVIDQRVKGNIAKVGDTTVIVNIVKDDGVIVEGIIRKEKIPLTINLVEGESFNGIISNIDTRKRKVFLVPALKEKPIGYK